MSIFLTIAPAGKFASAASKRGTVTVAPSDAQQILSLPGLIAWWAPEDAINGFEWTDRKGGIKLVHAQSSYKPTKATLSGKPMVLGAGAGAYAAGSIFPPEFTFVSVARMPNIGTGTRVGLFGSKDATTVRQALYYDFSTRYFYTGNATASTNVTGVWAVNTTGVFISSWNATDQLMKHAVNFGAPASASLTDAVAPGDKTIVGGIDTTITGGLAAGAYLGDMLIFNCDYQLAKYATYQTILSRLISARAPIGL